MLLSIHLPVSCSLSFKPSCVAIWQSIQPLTWHDLANMNIARRTSSATPAYHWIAIPCHSQRSQNCFPYYLQHEAQWYLGDNGTAGLLGVFETHLSSNSSDPFYAENRFMWPEVMDSRFPDGIHCLNDLFLRKFHRSGCWIRRDKGVCRLCLPPKMWILVNILYIIFYLQDLRSLVIGRGNLKHLFMFFYTFFFLQFFRWLNHRSPSCCLNSQISCWKSLFCCQTLDMLPPCVGSGRTTVVDFTMDSSYESRDAVFTGRKERR